MTSLTRDDGTRRKRIIEMWFPSAEVSAASQKGWGSSNSETLLMSWFAKRPLAQSRAATLCSLLPWPDDTDEQTRVQAVIREALGACQDPKWDEAQGNPGSSHAHDIIDCVHKDRSGGYDAARADVLALLADAYGDPENASTLDPFAGRGLIPVESARYGVTAHAIDYSPVAALASRLLIDWPFRDWSDEPALPFDPPSGQNRMADPSDPLRLVDDIATVHAEVQRRIVKELDEFYPDNDRGEKPWGYLWAQVIPCNGCGRQFPLFGSNTLRKPSAKKNDPGASFELHTNGDTWTIEVIEGETDQQPTMRARPGKRGKLAWCPFSDCGHAHELDEHRRLVKDHYDQLVMLVVSDLDGSDKKFRLPTDDERNAADAAAATLGGTKVNGLSGRPDERPVPGTTVHIRGTGYGAESFGDLSVDRQNLLHATIAQSIATIAEEMQKAGCSAEFATALAGYCGAALTRKVKRSTRGAPLDASRSGIGHIFINESSVGFNYDSFETGIGTGPGTWDSVTGTPTALDQLCTTQGRPAHVERGSALSLPMRTNTLDAVVTDPPYDFMIAYSDASDLYWVWLRRALAQVSFDFAMTTDPLGGQEKSEELIVKQNHYMNDDEHRTPEFYEANIAKAFAEANRVVKRDGIVSIIFGHGDPDVWRNLLDSVTAAGLVLVGAWPANTEKGGAAGSANINTTLTLACRPVVEDRPTGRVADVDAQVRSLVMKRVREVWTPSGLSLPDQKMAAVGPAMEVVGRYSVILDITGQPVSLERYLPLARKAVTDAWDLKFDKHPLQVFEPRTRFALEWVRTYGRRVAAASDARWQRLGEGMDEAETDAILKDVSKGVRFVYSTEVDVDESETSEQVEVALAMADAWRNGTLADCGTVLHASVFAADDSMLWAVISGLSQHLPETDKDGAVWRKMLQQRSAVVDSATSVAAVAKRDDEHDRQNPTIFDDPNSLFATAEGND